MLVMQPLQMRDKKLKYKFKLKLNDDDVLHIQKQILGNFASIQVVLRQVVVSTLLVFRFEFFFILIGLSDYFVGLFHKAKNELFHTI
jgi:hypothetical protein